MPSILTFEDRVYFDTASDVYHATENLKQYLCLNGELKVNEDTGAASIGGSPVAYKYVDSTTFMAKLNNYMRC